MWKPNPWGSGIHSQFFFTILNELKIKEDSGTFFNYEIINFKILKVSLVWKKKKKAVFLCLRLTKTVVLTANLNGTRTMDFCYKKFFYLSSLLQRNLKMECQFCNYLNHTRFYSNNVSRSQQNFHCRKMVVKCGFEQRQLEVKQLRYFKQQHSVIISNYFQSGFISKIKIFASSFLKCQTSKLSSQDKLRILIAHHLYSKE